MIEFIRIFDARVIPKKLVEQVPFVKGDEFYNLMKAASKFPLDHIFVMIDSMHRINGYVWYTLNVMNKSIFVNTISICDEWKHTDKTKMIDDFLGNESLRLGCKEVFFLTNKPAFYEKFGFVKTEQILLIKEYGDGSNGGNSRS